LWDRLSEKGRIEKGKVKKKAFLPEAGIGGLEH
jgi:hypothetical protein